MAEGRAIERRIVSVLFADLVGFTPLGERLDAEDVATIQDAYFAAVRETIGRYGGSLEKFIGDAAVGAFGVPRAREDDAERAVRAALAIVSAVEHLGARLGLEVGELRVRVGIATGEVALAIAGPDAGRITGDTVNTAARLQAAAPPGRVLLAESTALAVADSVELEAAGDLDLKGKAEPVRARLVTGMRSERSRDAAMGRLRAPTVGREAELGVLRGALERIGAGGPAEGWLVVAPPGVGKSRLLAEVVAEAEGRRLPAVTIRCRLEPEGPFAPIAELIRRLLDVAEPDASDLRGKLVGGGLRDPRLSVVATEIGHLLGAGAATTATREQRFDAWADGIEALAPREPHLWLVEDLHWASGDLVAFIGFLAARRDASRLLVLTTRPSLLERAPDLAADEPDAPIRPLELQPLPPGDAADLVDRLSGGALPPDLVQRIVDRSDGTPLFIEELLRVWVSVGTLVPQDDGWRLALHPSEIALPATVQAIYAAQLDDLPDMPRRAARHGSVSGRRVPVEALAALDVPRRSDAVAVLVRRAILRDADSDPIAGPMLAYRHALLRDAGYASLAKAERALLHVRLARWLEATAGSRTDSVAASIAAHWEAAVSSAPALTPDVGDGVDRPTARATAARWLEDAASVASLSSAHESASDLLRRALALTDEALLVDRARRLTRLADAERIAGDLQVAQEGYAAAQELIAPLLGAEGSVDGAVREVFSTAAARLATIRIERLAFEEARAGAAAALERLGEAEDAARVRLEIEHSRAVADIDNDYAAALERSETILAAARRVGNPALVREAVAEHVGSLHEADGARPEDWEEVAEAAAAVGNWSDAVSAGTNGAMLLLSIDPGLVADRVRPLAATAEAHRLREDACWLDYVTTEANLVLGHWERVVEDGVRVLEIGTRHGYDRAVVRTLHCLVPVAARRGEREVLARCAEWFERRRGSIPRSPYGLLFGAAVDVHFARHGLIAPSMPRIEHLRAGLALGEGGPSWLAALETLIDAWLEAGELDDAGDAATLIEASATSGGAAGVVVVRLLRARVAGAGAGQADPGAGTVASRLADDAAAIPAPWWEAQALRLVGDDAARIRAATIEASLGVRPIG